MLRISPRVLIGLLFSLLLLAYALHPDFRSLTHQVVQLLAKADITPVRAYLLGFGAWAPIVSTLLQLVTSIIAPLPSFVITFANAMIFGFWWGALLTGASWLLAARVCFGMARRLGRPVVERLATRRAPEATDRFVEGAGFWRPFLLIMAIGTLPATALYSYLGGRGITQVGWLMAPLVGLGLLTLAGAFFFRPASTRQPQACLRAAAASSIACFPWSIVPHIPQKP